MAQNSLARLIERLESLRAPADLDALEASLRDCDVSRAALGDAITFDPERYQRNIISRSQWHELLALCWLPGQSTPIHDHRGSACAFRVIQGDVTERRYAQNTAGVLRRSTSRVLSAGSICAAFDADIHDVGNEGEGELITLHIYSPPLHEFHCYEEGSSRVELITLDDALASSSSACD